MWQYSVSSAGWDSNGFSPALELPFVRSLLETLTNYHVEAVVIAQGVPNGVNQHFMGVLMDKLQPATEGAALSKIGELLQHCTFELIEPVSSIVSWISSPAKAVKMRCSTSDLSSLP